MKSKIIIFLILLATTITVVPSCNTFNGQMRDQKRRAKDTDKMVDNRQKEAEDTYEEHMKRLYKQQPRKTRKQMKANAKKSERIAKGKPAERKPIWPFNKLKKRKSHD